MTKGIVKAVCVSEAKGTEKRDIKSAYFEADWGIKNDAHAGEWHRQISLLSYDKVKKFNEQGAEVKHGDFGENLLVEGINFRALPIGARLVCGDCVLEITQIGKECHSRCNIYHRMGDCIMPREGVFARVVQSGTISAGDIMRLANLDVLNAAVLTLSNKGYSGEREDKSGPIIVEMLEEAGYQVAAHILLPDEQSRIEAELINFADNKCVDLILTTGGTGFSRRDVTPEATAAVAERHAPGIAEAIRAHSIKITGRAMLSRGVSVIRGGTLIINLPGSPKAVRECFQYILPYLRHGLEILRDSAEECADK